MTSRAERSMLRDALAEAAHEYTIDPTEAHRHVLQGMRFMAGLLGMPEGQSHYVWPDTADRRARRHTILRGRRAR